MSRSVQLHVHSFGLRFRLKHRHEGFDVFAYIALAAEMGFTGVNISANGPGYRDLCGTTPEHFAAVRTCAADHDLAVEIDTSDTSVAHLTHMLGVAAACGADTLRVYTRYTGTLAELKARTIEDLRAVAPHADGLGVMVVLENHEDFQGDAIAEIVGAVDNPAVRALYDYGNSQMVGEDPIVALEAMAPAISRVHMKDHVIVEHEGALWVQGVPMGEGLLPVTTQTDRLYEIGVRRLCFENVWGYTAPVTVGADQLPTTACFSLDHLHRFCDGRTLDPADAIEQEWQAFVTADRWLRDQLRHDGYTITRAPDGAPPTP